MVSEWITKWIGAFHWTHTIPSALYFPLLLLATYVGTWIYNIWFKKQILRMDWSTIIELVAYGSAFTWAVHGFHKCFFDMPDGAEHDILTQLMGSIAFFGGGVLGTINCMKKLINSPEDNGTGVFTGVPSPILQENPGRE